MKTLQQELIDFLIWAHKEKYNITPFKEEMVNEYLKSINSNSAGERRAIGSNEHQKKICIAPDDYVCNLNIHEDNKCTLPTICVYQQIV